MSNETTTNGYGDPIEGAILADPRVGAHGFTWPSISIYAVRPQTQNHRLFGITEVDMKFGLINVVCDDTDALLAPSRIPCSDDAMTARAPPSAAPLSPPWASVMTQLQDRSGYWSYKKAWPLKLAHGSIKLELEVQESLVP